MACAAVTVVLREELTLDVHEAFPEPLSKCALRARGDIALSKPR